MGIAFIEWDPIQSHFMHISSANYSSPRKYRVFRRFSRVSSVINNRIRLHSTETAVTRVYNDLLQAADGGQVSVLCLLDLSAAFYTVYHKLPTLRLEHQGRCTPVVSLIPLQQNIPSLV